MTTDRITADNLTSEQIAGFRDRQQTAIGRAYADLAAGSTPRVALSTTPYGARIHIARSLRRRPLAGK